MKTKRRLITTFLTIAGAIAMFMFNFFFLEHLIIPDPCYYHSHDAIFLFDWFYNLSDGGHPFPTLFNLIFTLIIGALLGWTFSKSVIKNLTT